MGNSRARDYEDFVLTATAPVLRSWRAAKTITEILLCGIDFIEQSQLDSAAQVCIPYSHGFKFASKIPAALATYSEVCRSLRN